MFAFSLFKIKEIISERVSEHSFLKLNIINNKIRIVEKTGINTHIVNCVCLHKLLQFVHLRVQNFTEYNNSIFFRRINNVYFM